MYTIYALVDPRDRSVHYVGQTIDVYARFQRHVDGEGSYAKNAWVFELRSINQMIIMETLEQVETHQEAIEREAYWIRHFEVLSEPILNVHHRASARKAKKANLRAKNQIIVNIVESELQLPIQAPVEPTPVAKPKQTPKLQEALDAYKNGCVTSRSLAQSIGIGKTRAYELIQKMKSENLI